MGAISPIAALEKSFLFLELYVSVNGDWYYILNNEYLGNLLLKMEMQQLVTAVW